MRNCPNKKTINMMTHQEIFSMVHSLMNQQEELVADDTPEPSAESTPEKEVVDEDEIVEGDLPPGMNFYHEDE